MVPSKNVLGAHSNSFGWVSLPVLNARLASLWQRGCHESPRPAVANRAVAQRILGMGDAVAGGHRVDLAGADDLLVAQAVAVQHLALRSAR